MGNAPDHDPAGAVGGHFRRLLAGTGKSGGALESVSGADSTGDDLPARASRILEGWYPIIRKYLDDDPQLYAVVDRMAKEGTGSLQALADGDDARIAGDPAAQASLEVIVRLDGSRPSFMVQNGKVNLETSPAGSWAGRVNGSAGLLEHALQCVGRIDHDSLPQGFAGTGFLIQENLILTNRHVLEEIGTINPDGTWTLKPGAAIDFGHEYEARETSGRRLLRKVVFAGPDAIDHSVDHAHLDLALIETEAPDPKDKLDYYLSLDLSPGWGTQNREIYCVGYPGAPRFGDESLTLLEKLFKATYGCKRCAPGIVMRDRNQLPSNPRKWSVAHDATTLGGNSGSVILQLTREDVSAGIHYGGVRAAPRENWCHVLGLTLGAKDGFSPRTLRQHLDERGVEFSGSSAE